ncbi:MAG: hypothetical protein KDD12_26825, partial [Lewinella sp.]|nr:hypothetical protein [Lewinella sp.]
MAALEMEAPAELTRVCPLAQYAASSSTGSNSCLLVMIMVMNGFGAYTIAFGVAPYFLLEQFREACGFIVELFVDHQFYPKTYLIQGLNNSPIFF